MAIKKVLARSGNSDALVITKEMQQHLGLGSDKLVEIHYKEDGILIKAPSRQSFEDAARSTFEQFDEALRNLSK